MEFDGRSFHQMSGRIHKLATLERTFKRKEHVEFGKFTGEGVQFKAKLIGVLEVSEARGELMCQDALAELKMAIKAAGEHKLRIIIHISLEGMKLKDEKTGDCLYHHPVHKISFIAQDLRDPRAFGYVFGSPDLGHKFFGIKTEKAANQVVITMRDLFQVVFEMKKDEMDKAKHHITFPTKFDTKAHSGLYVRDHSRKTELSHKKEEPQNALADLLGLQFELDNLEYGINQLKKMSPQSEKTPLKSSSTKRKDDPFGDSFQPSVEIPVLQPPPPNTRHQKTNSSAPYAGGSDMGANNFDPFNTAPFKSTKPNTIGSNSGPLFPSHSSIDRYAPLAEISRVLGNANIFETPKSNSPKRQSDLYGANEKVIPSWNQQDGKHLNEPPARQFYGRVPVRQEDESLKEVPLERYGKLSYLHTLPNRKQDPVNDRSRIDSTTEWPVLDLFPGESRRMNPQDKRPDPNECAREFCRPTAASGAERRNRDYGEIAPAHKLDYREVKTLGRMHGFKGSRDFGDSSGIRSFDNSPGLTRMGDSFGSPELHRSKKVEACRAQADGSWNREMRIETSSFSPNPLSDKREAFPNDFRGFEFGPAKSWVGVNDKMTKSRFVSNWDVKPDRHTKEMTFTKWDGRTGRDPEAGFADSWDMKPSKEIQEEFSNSWNFDVRQDMQGKDPTVCAMDKLAEKISNIDTSWKNPMFGGDSKTINRPATEPSDLFDMGFKLTDDRDFEETLTHKSDKPNVSKVLGDSLDDFADFKCFDPLACAPDSAAPSRDTYDFEDPKPDNKVALVNDDSSSESEGAPIPPVRSFSVDQDDSYQFDKTESQNASRPQSTVTDRSISSTPDLVDESTSAAAPDPPPRPSAAISPPPLPPKRQQIQVYEKPVPKDQNGWRYDEAPRSKPDTSPLSPPLPLPLRKTKSHSSTGDKSPSCTSSEGNGNTRESVFESHFDSERMDEEILPQGSLGLSPSQITSMSLKELARRFPDMSNPLKIQKLNEVAERSECEITLKDPNSETEQTGDKDGFEADFSANNFSDSNGFDPKTDRMKCNGGKSYFEYEMKNSCHAKSKKSCYVDSSPEAEKKYDKVPVKDIKKPGSNEDSETEMSSYYSCSVGRDDDGDHYFRQRPHSDERYFNRSNYMKHDGKKDENFAWAFTRYSDRPIKKEVHTTRHAKDMAGGNRALSCSHTDISCDVPRKSLKRVSPRQTIEDYDSGPPDSTFIDPWDNFKNNESRDGGSGYGHLSEGNWQGKGKPRARTHSIEEQGHYVRYQHAYRPANEDFSRHQTCSPRARMSRAPPGPHREMADFFADDNIDRHPGGPPYHTFSDYDAMRSPYRYSREAYGRRHEPHDAYPYDSRHYGHYGPPWAMRPDYGECVPCSRGDPGVCEESRAHAHYFDRRSRAGMSRARTSPFDDDFTLDSVNPDPWEPSGRTSSSRTDSSLSERESGFPSFSKTVSKTFDSKDSFGDFKAETYNDAVFSPNHANGKSQEDSWAVFDKKQDSVFEREDSGDPWSETFPPDDSESSVSKSQNTSAMKKSESLNIFQQEGDPFSDDPFFSSDTR